MGELWRGRWGGGRGRMNEREREVGEEREERGKDE